MSSLATGSAFIVGTPATQISGSTLNNSFPATIDPTATQAYVAVYITGTNRSVNSVTIGSISGSQVPFSRISDGNGNSVEWWQVNAPPTGSQTVLVNLTGNADNGVVVVCTTSGSSVGQVNSFNDSAVPMIGVASSSLLLTATMHAFNPTRTSSKLGPFQHQIAQFNWNNSTAVAVMGASWQRGAPFQQVGWSWDQSMASKQPQISIIEITSFPLPPSPTGTIVLDTRAGGAHDITGLNNLATALSVAGLNNSASPPVQFTTTFSGNASGRAFVLPWTSGSANSLFIEKPGISGSGILCIQYKTWYGTVAGDGIGWGTVGVYDHFNASGSGQSHKHAVIFRRDLNGTPGLPNDERHTWVYGRDTGSAGLHGFFLDVDARELAEGTSSGANTATAFNDINQTFSTSSVGQNIHIFRGTGASSTYVAVTSVNSSTQLGVASWPAGTPDSSSQYRLLKAPTEEYFQDDWSVNSGSTIPVNLNNYINQVNTITYKVKPESLALMKDGYFFEWLNNQLMVNFNNFYSGEMAWGDIQIGGPTWNNGPLQNQSQYIWDLVVWYPTS